MVDGSPLSDGRRDAGIGRYVRGLFDALQGQPGMTATLAQPWRPPHESLVARFLSAQPSLLAGAARLHPDVVHATDAAPVLGFPKSHQVVTVHDVVPWTRARSGVTGAYLRGQAHRIRLCARVIAVSQSVAADVTRVLGVDPGRVRVVPEGYGAAFTDVSDIAERGVTLIAGNSLIRSPEDNRGLIEHALAEAASGRLRPVIGQSFPLAQATAAHSAIEARATVGKTVLTT